MLLAGRSNLTFIVNRALTTRLHTRPRAGAGQNIGLPWACCTTRKFGRRLTPGSLPVWLARLLHARQLPAGFFDYIFVIGECSCGSVGLHAAHHMTSVGS